MIAQLAAVAVAAIIFTLLYDPFHVGMLAFLALTPITIVIANPGQDCSVVRAGVLGFLFGLMAALGIVGWWMMTAAFDYFDSGFPWAVGFTLFANTVYVALFTAPAFMAIRLLAYVPPLIRAVGAAAVWTTFETLRGMDPAANAWAHLGQAFAYLPVLRESAAYGGQPLLGFLAGLCGAAIGVGLQTDVNARESTRCMIAGVGAPVLIALLGGLEYWRETENAPLNPLRVGVVQAEIPSRDVWDPAKRMAHWNAYVTATEAIPVGSLDLIVWPESAAPFLLNADTASLTRLADLAQRQGAAILLGAPRTEDRGDGSAALYNSAWFFAPGAPGPRTYDKQRLLPYVETTPMPGAEIPEGAAYEAGDSQEYFDVKGWRIAPLLCFEAVYPQYAREAVLGGAHLLVNLSNDAWFSAGSGPEQHYAMSLLRTVELRRPMVRAANGGISGAIGIDGEEIGFAIRRQKTVGIYEIPAPPRRTTLTAEFPEMVPLFAAFLALVTTIYGARKMLTPPEAEQQVEVETFAGSGDES